MIDSSKPTVAVWGHFHGGNLGDDLVVSTVVDAVRTRYPEARIVGVSLAPADTKARHGIEVFPINPGAALVHQRGSGTTGPSKTRTLRKLVRRVPLLGKARSALSIAARVAREPRFALQVYRFLRDVDLVVVAGSGAIADYWGPWQHPYTTFRWAGLARLARTPMAFLSVGVGPVEASLSAFFFRRAIAWSSYFSARDRVAARFLASMGGPASIPVVPDMGFGLPERLWPASPSTPRSLRDVTMTVGLNVMAHQDPRYFRALGPSRYEGYLDRMADFARSLLDEGHSVVLFSSQTVADELVAEDVMRLLETEPRSEGRLRSSVDTTRDLEDLVQVLAECDLIVAARFHSVLLPVLFDIPAIGIVYQAKTSELLRDIGYPQRAFEIDKVTGPELTKAVSVMVADRPGGQQRRNVAASRAAVIRQFDEVLASALPAPVGLLPTSGPRSGSWPENEGPAMQAAAEQRRFRAEGSGS